MRSATDQAQIDRRRARAKADQGIKDTVIRTLMSDPSGRRYIWLELAELKIWDQTIVFAPGGNTMTAFNEGKRSVGLRLLKEVTRLCPNEFMRMMVENSAIEQKEETNDGSRNPDSDADPDAGDSAD